MTVQSIDLDPKSITIRPDRQRKDFTTEDLDESIAAKGVLQPIIINEAHELIAGERRLTSALKLGLTSIPCRLHSDLSVVEQEEIEFEENVKRRDLTWQQQCLAAYRLHQIYSSQSKDPESWPKEGTAQRLRLSARHTIRLINLGEALFDGDEVLAKAESLSAANTQYDRRTKREQDEAVQQVMEMAKRPRPAPTLPVVTLTPDLFTPTAVLINTPDEVPFRVLHGDLLDFFSTYSGERFNFLHADLPYGVELNGQAGQGAFEGGGYESSPEIYWNLIEAIINGWDRVMFPSSHMMFWFSFFGNEGEGFYQETISRLEAGIAGMKIQRNPLIWHKSDNRGILADPKRGPRNITEFAFIGTTGDRFIVKPVSNLYSAPIAKADTIHTNEKPLSMLNHFFQMFVDQHTRLLDPTAGSGSAIRAAEIAGAELALGLEFNEEFAKRAQNKLEQERGLRALSEKVG